MSTTIPNHATDTPDRSDLVAAGDADLLAERYEAATAKYRDAIASGAGGDALAHKLQRAEGAAASAVSRGEQQTRVFVDRLSQVASGELLVPAPDLPPPAAADRPRRGLRHAVGVRTGRALGAVGSAVFHRLTKLAGRRGASGETWTDWYSVGSRLPGPLRKWYQILKLAHMRETLFENNLVRSYPAGAKTGYVDGELEPPAWARRWRSADGSWNYRLKDEDGRHDPMVGAAYTRFFRNVCDDRGLV
ncbi:MAG: hypothetical protein ACR2JD_04685, partial [Nocardioides sp.]